jgi:ABC-2 type transport system permease protein
MADLEQPWNPDRQIADAGSFSRLARGQYAAIALMRIRLFVNGFRTTAGAFEFGARTTSFFIYCCMGLSLGVGAGGVAYSIVIHERWQSLTMEFWIASFVWLAIAIALASFQEQYDLSGLLQFPVRFRTFFLLHLIFGLVDVSTVVGGLCSIGILVAITCARPALFASALIALAGFCAFNVLLVRAILAWIDRWLAKRRSREIVSALFLLTVLSLQLLNPVVRYAEPPAWDSGHNRNPGPDTLTDRLQTWSNSSKAVLAWLPAGLTASIPRQAGNRELWRAGGSLCLLGCYVFVAGGFLALRLRREYRGESLSETSQPSRTAKSASPGLTVGSGPVAAQIEKEIQSLLRSMPQLFSICVPVLMVFVIASLFHSGLVMSQRPGGLALPVCVAYGVLGFTQLMYNNLGSEGKGIQMLFLFPVPMRTILLGKNLFHGLLYVVVAFVAGCLAAIRLGDPGATTIVTTAGWLAFALPANLAAGDLLSLMMAYRVHPGRIGRQSGSQANALASMLVQAGVLGIGAAVISLSNLSKKPWLAVPIFMAIACLAVLAWILVLRSADRIAQLRKDSLLGRLAKIE